MDYLLIFISIVGSLSFIRLVWFAIKNWRLIQRDEPIPLLKGLGIYSLLILLAAILAIAPLTYPELPSIIKQLLGGVQKPNIPVSAESIVGNYIYKSEPIRYNKGTEQPLLIGEDGETYYQFIGTVEIKKDKGVIKVCGYRQFAITLDSLSNLKITEAGVTWTVPPEKIYNPQASENQVIFFLETKPGLTSSHSDRNLAIYLGTINKNDSNISGFMYYLNDRKYKSGEDTQFNELLVNPTWTRAKMELKKVENFGGNYSYFTNGAFIDWLSKDKIKEWFEEFRTDPINDLSALDSLKRKATEKPKIDKCNNS